MRETKRSVVENRTVYEIVYFGTGMTASIKTFSEKMEREAIAEFEQMVGDPYSGVVSLAKKTYMRRVEYK